MLNYKKFNSNLPRTCQNSLLNRRTWTKASSFYTVDSEQARWHRNSPISFWVSHRHAPLV